MNPRLYPNHPWAAAYPYIGTFGKYDIYRATGTYFVIYGDWGDGRGVDWKWVNSISPIEDRNTVLAFINMMS